MKTYIIAVTVEAEDDVDEARLRKDLEFNMNRGEGYWLDVDAATVLLTREHEEDDSAQ